jgi:carbon catabolite-derepressing protein kinase
MPTISVFFRAAQIIVDLFGIVTNDGTSIALPVNVGGYVFESLIGAGSTSVVLKGLRESTGRVVAFKVISREEIETRQAVANLNPEVSVIRGVDHPHLARYEDVVYVDDVVIIVMEYYPECLLSWVTDGRPLSRMTTYRIFRQIASAAQCLSTLHISHLEIKPDNIMMDGHGDDQKGGTVLYAAPELFRRGGFASEQSDIWSLSVLLFLLRTRRFPYVGGSPKEIRDQIVQDALMDDFISDSGQERSSAQ